MENLLGQQNDVRQTILIGFGKVLTNGDGYDNRMEWNVKRFSMLIDFEI